MEKVFEKFEEQAERVKHLVKETNKLPVLIIQQHPIDDGRELLFPPVRESLSNIISFAEVCGPEPIKHILNRASQFIDAFILDIDKKRENSDSIIAEVKKNTGSIPLMFYSDYGMWSSAAISFVLSIVKSLTDKRVLLLGNNFLATRLLQLLLNYGSTVYMLPDDWQSGLFSLDTDTSLMIKSERIKTVSSPNDTFDIILGASVLKPHPADISHYSSTKIFDIGLRNFKREYIKQQASQGATIYRFDNRAGISSVVLNLMETEYLTTKNMGSVNVGRIKVISGGILGEEDSIVVDNAFAPEFLFGVADGEGMFKSELTQKNLDDIGIIKELIKK